MSRAATTATAPPALAEAFKEGITLCRKEKWHQGYEVLVRVAQGVERRGNLPGIFYSYLGLAMAHCDGRRHEPIELCRYALRVQPDQPENYLNLASLYLILGRRDSAVRLVEHGLQIRPGHARLRELQQQLGVRQPLLFASLSRRHPLNALPGRMRSWARRRRERAEERRAEIAQFGA